jgi:uncharacterized protein YqeY
MILDLFRSKQIEYTKSKQSEELDVLRFFLSQVKYKEIELRPQSIELNDEHVYKVLKKLIKQATESMEMYQKAGRTEAFEKSKKEIEVLTKFVELFPAELRQQ